MHRDMLLVAVVLGTVALVQSTDGSLAALCNVAMQGKTTDAIMDLCKAQQAEDTPEKRKNEFVRFGKRKNEFVRFGRMVSDGLEEAAIPDKRKNEFIRFGKRKNEFVRFGRPDGADTTGFAKRKNEFIRFGKRKNEFIRFGKRKNEFIRFGRAGDGEGTVEEAPAKRKNEFIRFGKRKNEFVRFG